MGNITAGNEVLLISIPDLGVVIPSFNAGLSSTASTNGIIGVASQWANGVNNYLYSSFYCNSPLRISHKPKSSLFTVNLLKIDGTVSNIAAPNSYVLSITFDRMKQN